MSLQNLARHMEAQGRGPDRTLVHMTPKEVQGLQAIAMAHGGSLTINPVTGLPEAGFLDSLLPAIAGFALNAFAPGVGTAVGGMFGLGGAAGTALAIGGISGLASGNLEKGIMAGLGAYGGAALGDSAGYGAGAAKTAQEANNVAAGLAVAEEQNAAALGSKAAGQSQVGGGIAAAANAPKDFLKDNKLALAALLVPALSGSQGKGPEALPSSGHIRKMKRDPVTGEIYQESATPTAEFGSQSVGTYGGVPRMADGGQVDDSLANFRQSMGEGRLNTVGVGDDPFAQVAYDTRTDSQKSFDYLMGRPGAVNPMSFPRSTGTGPMLPIDYGTRTGGKYILDTSTNSYVWVPDATAGLPSKGGAGSYESSGGGSDPNQGNKTDWGGILGDPTLTGKDWSELTPDQQETASGIVDPYGIGKGIAGLVSGSLYGKVATGLGNFFSGRTPDGGYDLGFNPGMLGTGKGTQSEGKVGEDTAGKAAPGMQAQQQADAVKGFEDTQAQTAINAAAAGFDPQSFTTPGAAVSADQNAAVQSQVAADMQSMQDAYNADMSAAQSAANVAANNAAAEAQSNADQNSVTSGEFGSTDATSAADNSGNTSSDSGGSSGDGTGGEARGGLNANGRYYPPRYAHGGLAALAQGGITGSGNLDLSIPLNISGGSMGSAGSVGGGSYPFTSIGSQRSSPQQTFGSSNNPRPFVGSNNAPSMMPQQGVTPLPGQNPYSMSQGMENVVTQPPRGRGYAPPGYILGPLDQMMTVENYNAMYGGNPNPKQQGMAFAGGGISHLGDYSDGGRLLRGPGDGVSDSIPATIGKKRPARLADGEFVISADVVSGLGNGSTEAGAKQLYAMMDRIRKSRTGTKKMGKTINAKKHLPA